MSHRWKGRESISFWKAFSDKCFILLCVTLSFECDGPNSFEDTHIKLWKLLIPRSALHTSEKHFGLLVRKTSTGVALSPLKQLGCSIRFTIPYISHRSERALGWNQLRKVSNGVTVTLYLKQSWILVNWDHPHPNPPPIYFKDIEGHFNGKVQIGRIVMPCLDIAERICNTIYCCLFHWWWWVYTELSRDLRLTYDQKMTKLMVTLKMVARSFVPPMLLTRRS